MGLSYRRFLRSSIPELEVQDILRGTTRRSRVHRRRCGGKPRLVRLPDDWMGVAYDDSGWLPAATCSADDVTRSPAFRDYEDTVFKGGRFIWTSSLDLDNLGVCRATIASPPAPEN